MDRWRLLDQACGRPLPCGAPQRTARAAGYGLGIAVLVATAAEPSTAAETSRDHLDTHGDAIDPDPCRHARGRHIDPDVLRMWHAAAVLLGLEES